MAFQRYTVRRLVTDRAPTDEGKLSWLQREVHPILKELRKVLNWCAQYVGLLLADANDDTPDYLQNKLADTASVTWTLNGATHKMEATAIGFYDFTFYVPGLLTSAETLASFPTVRYVTLPAGLTGSFGSVLFAPLADATITIKKNSTTIGTITIASGATAAVFTMAADCTLIPGTDYLNFVNQAVADATMAGLRITLKGEES